MGSSFLQETSLVTQKQSDCPPGRNSPNGKFVKTQLVCSVSPNSSNGLVQSGIWRTGVEVKEDFSASKGVTQICTEFSLPSLQENNNVIRISKVRDKWQLRGFDSLQDVIMNLQTVEHNYG
jgi:hypothetical protein